MSDAYSNAVGGRLKLKGKPLAVKGGVAKKVSSPATKVITPQKEQQIVEQIIMPEDPRTASEIAFEQIRKERERERVAKMAEKSHRERVDEFNKHLASLSEHHDIPKVDPRNQ